MADLPEPVTREEMFLSAVAGESATLPEPVTREELFLAKAAGEDVTTPEPVTRREMFLDAIATGGGGTSDYAELTNKPSINGVTLSGNKSTSDLGITATPMTEITYAALVTLRDNGELIPGMQYRITDYETIITGSYDLSALGAQGYLHNARSAGHPFDVIVVADDESHLNENARAALHEGDTYFANSKIGAWKLKYSLDNNAAKYTWAHPTNGKGVIYWMEDEFNNRVGYDFKNIQFLRYALKLADATADYTPTGSGLVYNSPSQPNRYGSMYHIFTALQAYMQGGQYANPFRHQYKGTTNAVADYDFAVGANILGTIQSAEPDATYLSTFGADWYYTFDYWDSDFSEHIDTSLNSIGKIPCRENYIEIETDPVTALTSNSYQIFGLGGSVWETNSYFVTRLDKNQWCSISENHLGIHNWYNTFGDSCSRNTFGNNCYSNTFGTNCYSNTFGNNCYRNTFGTNCYSNTFGINCYSNTFGTNCYSNTFGNDCYSNTFGNNCYSNTFGTNCYSNTFGNDCSRNTFGNDCSSNTFGKSDQNNNFVGNMWYLHCGDHVQSVSADTTQYGINTSTVKTLENYNGSSGYATLITKTGYQQESAMTTTDSGQTWTAV